MQPNTGETELQHKKRAPYKFSAEEIRVLKECNYESFYYRCVPLGTILGVTAYHGVKSGFLRGNPRFGAIPKVTVGVVVGYFLGKFSYQTRCAEKLMQLPNSQLGEMLRRRRQGAGLQESFDSGFSSGLGPFSNYPSSDSYDKGPGSSVDIDTTRPSYDGLDDSHRPSLDNPMYEEEMPPEQKHVTTYDELRRKNREEYQAKRTSNYYNREPVRASAPSQPLTEPEIRASQAMKNKYGDVLE